MAVDGQPSSFPPKPPDSRMSYASAASGSISFNLKKPLIPLSSYRGEPAIVVPEDVIKESLVDFNFALVGKFPIYPKIIRPNMERIRLFFARLNLKAAYSIGSLDLGHILIRLNSAEDYQRIWARETWDIDKVQMKIFKWSMDFASHKESSIIPAWILLPGLPPNFFQQHILFSIVQVVGNPLKMDQATATLSRPSIARICVELDLLTPNPSRIWISSGNKDKGFWQKIDYEYLPLYCCDCFRLGHSQAACPGSMMPSPNLQHNYRESPQHRQPLRGQESNSKDVSNNIVKFSSHGLQVSRSAINASDADVSTAPTNVAPQSVYVPQIWVPRVKKMMSHNQNNENAGNSSIVVSNAFASLQELEEESAPANIDHLISGNLLQHGTNASAVDLQQDNSADLEQGAESTNIISPHSQQGVDLQQSDNQLTQPILHRSCCLDQSPFQQSSEIVAENLMPVHTHHLSLVDLNTNTEMSGEKTNKQVKLGRINTYTSEEKTNTEMSGGTLNNVSLCTQNANTHVQACPNLQGILKLINSSAADPIPEDGDVEDVEDNSEEIAINREKNTKDNSAGVEEMSINAEKYTEDSPVHVNGKEIIPWTGINCDEIDLTHNSSGLNARARGFLIPKTRSTFKIGRKPVIDKIRAAEEQGKTVFSFEFFPPKTEDGVDNLFERIDRMVSYGPSFCDITWGAGGSTADITLDIANKMQNMICVETMMHLTCTNMPVEKIDDALKNIKGNGIQNVLALRGDPPHGQDKFVQIEDGFACALDLVKHIRSTYGAYFGITVAGYPEAHPDVIQSDGLATPEGYQSDLEYLKRKVDAGADLIVTQLFYDTDIFLKFVNDCRQIGINCPIVPGIMPINSYKGFLRMTGFCKTKIPAEIMAALEPIQENEEAVKAYGIHLGTEMCKKILAHGIQTLHLYTLNVDKSAVSILMNLGLIEEGKISRSLPWRPPTNVFRTKENVRPIFWANRSKSYISRTMEWEDYPHGHWGVSRNPSYGALTDQQFLRSRARDKKLNEEWGIPVKSVEDIQEQFTKFWLGELKSSPWSEVDGLQSKIKIISEQLGKINQKGFLTINSQPAVNGESSDSQTVGWGGPGGFVYQKAYVEFFCSKEKLTALVDKCKDVPSLTYMAINKEGVLMSNLGNPNVNAVTWGAFPGKEIVQSLVVDAASFLIWKEEAFEIWSRGWARLYPEDDPSRELLNEVQGSYFLVSLVDNDYIKGDLFAVFKEL